MEARWVDYLPKLKETPFLLSLVSIFVYVAPGLLAISFFKPEYLKELDVVKIILLSLVYSFIFISYACILNWLISAGQLYVGMSMFSRLKSMMEQFTKDTESLNPNSIATKSTLKAAARIRKLERRLPEAIQHKNAKSIMEYDDLHKMTMFVGMWLTITTSTYIYIQYLFRQKDLHEFVIAMTSVNLIFLTVWVISNNRYISYATAMIVNIAWVVSVLILILMVLFL